MRPHAVTDESHPIAEEGARALGGSHGRPRAPPTQDGRPSSRVESQARGSVSLVDACRPARGPDRVSVRTIRFDKQSGASYPPRSGPRSDTASTVTIHRRRAVSAGRPIWPDRAPNGRAPARAPGVGMPHGVASSHGMPLGAGRRSARAAVPWSPSPSRTRCASGSRRAVNGLSAAHPSVPGHARLNYVRWRDLAAARSRLGDRGQPPRRRRRLSKWVSDNWLGSCDVDARHPWKDALAPDAPERVREPAGHCRFHGPGRGDRARAVRTAARACQPLRGAGRAVVLRAE